MSARPPAADLPPDVTVIFGLGANLGDRLAALQRAIDVITADPAVTAVSVVPVS